MKKETPRNQPEIQERCQRMSWKNHQIHDHCQEDGTRYGAKGNKALYHRWVEKLHPHRFGADFELQREFGEYKTIVIYVFYFNF